MRCFTATYKNKKFQHGAFLLSTLVPHLTELSKVFQAVCFDFAQGKPSIELYINKLPDAAVKSELKANCVKFDSEFGELGTPDGLADSCVSSGMAFWKSAERLANWSPHTKNGDRSERTHQQRHLFAKPPRNTACQDGKIIEPKLDDTQCGFCRGLSTTEQISTLRQIFEKSREHANDFYTAHVLSISRKHTIGFLVKSFGGCCGSTVLMGASCWQSSNCISAQKIVSVLTELITTVQRWCWTPTIVCAVPTPLHSLYQGSPNYDPRAKSSLRSHFTRLQNTLCQ